jgi:hypothetical protein
VRRNIIGYKSEVEMSDQKQVKPRRAAAAPASKAAPAPAAPVLSEPEPVVAPPAPARRRQESGAGGFFAACQVTLASLGEAQTAIASDFSAMALEISGLARSSLTAATDSAAALFAATSFGDAIEIQLGFARRSLDAMVDGSTKLGEFGLRLASDATKPMLRPFSAR